MGERQQRWRVADHRVSSCWLTQDHPDPDGKQLATVAAVLEQQRARYSEANNTFDGFSEMGVFRLGEHRPE